MNGCSSLLAFENACTCTYTCCVRNVNEPTLQYYTKMTQPTQLKVIKKIIIKITPFVFILKLPSLEWEQEILHEIRSISMVCYVEVLWNFLLRAWSNLQSVPNSKQFSRRDLRELLYLQHFLHAPCINWMKRKIYWDSFDWIFFTRLQQTCLSYII